MLEARKGSFAEVAAVLTEYQRNIGEISASAVVGTDGREASGQELEDEGAKQRAIIGHLVDYLRGC